MIAFDTHLHTDFSTDSCTPLSEQLSRAEELTLKGICITDHMDYDFPACALEHPVEGIPFCFDWTSYSACIESARKNTDCMLYTGVECGLQNTDSVIQKNRQLRSRKTLDYMIGSLHLVDGRDPYYPSFWHEKDPRACILHYFEILYENLQLFHDFDSLGHLDYIVRYAPSSYSYVPDDFRDILDSILTFLIQKDIALEINTSGFKTEGRCPNPHMDILTWYQEQGGELITIGSDAHKPEYMAFRFDQITDMLQKTGLRQYVVYQQHKPVFYDL